MKRLSVTVLAVLTLASAHIGAQAARPDFSGMWSDPPSTAVDVFCFIVCTQTGIDFLNKLLDDPANDSRPFAELSREANQYQMAEYIRPRLIGTALKTFPIDPADDPGFLRCEPWGLARQFMAPHQMEMRQFDDRIEVRYAEWDGRRTIHMNAKTAPANQAPSPMGYSVGRWEGSVLVVESSALTANLAGLFGNWFSHSAELTTTERYTRIGDRLELTVTLRDRLSLQQPLELKHAWAWAPDEKIFPYTGCEQPTEFRRRENQK
jgi:hypothetical protein